MQKGCKTKGEIGAEIHEELPSHDECISLWEYTIEFEQQMYAKNAGMFENLIKYYNNRKIIILTNSQETVKSSSCFESRSKQVGSLSKHLCF